ncbi:caspase family protein [Trichocoleus sp. DQ-A3]|uniref:caspase family protein n=1 Tax=Cyanophyceae TaxID=3028117 RepID=UPI001682DEBB|nr:caspase family protein [Coleofasciculus sp. FACHB-125]MBD1903801.1 caspase family protein [Coleofasciculus sp. FACHB-125]
MSSIKRRHFLQFAGSTLATLGLSQFDFLQQANQYGKVLAQGTPRKLALLVGINQYPNGIRSLNGCLTDIELQWELLVHRFGFSPKDILVVGDRKLAFTDYEPLKPTRQNILDAFENHLIKNAKPGDVVVFHYSGHGSLVLDNAPNPLFKDDQGQGINGTLVPFDRIPGNSSSDNQVRDIMGRSLFLLMRALKTENVTVVLDSCHSGGGTRGNLEIRAISSRLSGGTAAPAPEEVEYQRRWIKDLKLSDRELDALRNQGIAKGVAIGSARYNQEAADAPFGGFHAGAFTYLLTRYLWQRTRDEAVGTVFVNLSRSTKDVANASGIPQEPIYEANPAKNSQQPLYFFAPATPAAEAVIRAENNGQIEFWLGGVSARTLDATGKGTIFTIIDEAGKPLGEIEQLSRTGLVGYGKLRQGEPSAVKPGRFLRERIRAVPNDLKLQIALDPSLGTRLEATKAALQAIKRMEVVPLGQTARVDYILGRLTPAIAAAQAKLPDLPPAGSVGLFTAAQVPVTATFARANESAAAAVERLRPRLISLLAGRILQLTLSSEAARLQVATSVVPTGEGTPAIANGVQQFKTGTTMQVKVRNNEQRDLHIAVLVISATGNLAVLYPYWDAPDIASLVSPGQELAVPKADDPYQFRLRGTSGFVEVLVLATTKPLRQSLQTLEAIGRGRGLNSRSFTPLQDNEPLDIIESLVGDLDRNSRGDGDIKLEGARAIGVAGTRAVDTTQLATISHVIEVVTS